MMLTISWTQTCVIFQAYFWKILIQHMAALVWGVNTCSYVQRLLLVSTGAVRERLHQQVPAHSWLWPVVLLRRHVLQFGPGMANRNAGWWWMLHGVVLNTCDNSTRYCRNFLSCVPGWSILPVCVHIRKAMCLLMLPTWHWTHAIVSWTYFLM